MTQNEIIEMARKAGLYQDINVSFHQALRNFYNLATERTWVGLTFREQQEAILNTHSVHEALIKAEAKLKEKNT